MSELMVQYRAGRAGRHRFEPGVKNYNTHVYISEDLPVTMITVYLVLISVLILHFSISTLHRPITHEDQQNQEKF